MTTEKAYLLYWGMHLHFKTEDYSMLKYGCSTKNAISKFKALSQDQLFKFEWLSKKFSDSQSFAYASIGCHFDGLSLQYATKDDIYDSYLKFKSRRESLTYVIKSNLRLHQELDLQPIEKLIYKYFVEEISPEYVILITSHTNELETIYNSPNFTWAKDKMLKLIKYKSFFNIDKYITLIENKENVYC